MTTEKHEFWKRTVTESLKEVLGNPNKKTIKPEERLNGASAKKS